MYGPDEFYITDIKGLDSPPRRTPTDNAPQTHGGLVHPRLKGPRPITFEGASHDPLDESSEPDPDHPQ